MWMKRASTRMETGIGCTVHPIVCGRTFSHMNRYKKGGNEQRYALYYYDFHRFERKYQAFKRK